MNLRNFSVRLAVKEAGGSEAVYCHLECVAIGGDQDQSWLIMKNETCVIGLFQGMFEKNMLTLNPG